MQWRGLDWIGWTRFGGHDKTFLLSVCEREKSVTSDDVFVLGVVGDRHTSTVDMVVGSHRLVKESEAFFSSLSIYRYIDQLTQSSCMYFDVVEEKVNVVVRNKVYCTILNSSHPQSSNLQPKKLTLQLPLWCMFLLDSCFFVPSGGWVSELRGSEIRSKLPEAWLSVRTFRQSATNNLDPGNPQRLQR